MKLIILKKILFLFVLFFLLNVTSYSLVYSSETDIILPEPLDVNEILEKSTNSTNQDHPLFCFQKFSLRSLQLLFKMLT